jgi:hypothetical protein
LPNEPDKLHQEGNWLWIPLKNEWRDSIGKPEEIVRQRFIRHLCETYEYAPEQMRQEQRMIAGSRSARADIVIWEMQRKLLLARACRRFSWLSARLKALRSIFATTIKARATPARLVASFLSRQTIGLQLSLSLFPVLPATSYNQ